MVRVWVNSRQVKDILLNNFFSECLRDLGACSTPTNEGAPVRLVPPTSFYDLGKWVNSRQVKDCNYGQGLG